MLANRYTYLLHTHTYMYVHCSSSIMQQEKRRINNFVRDCMSGATKLPKYSPKCMYCIYVWVSVFVASTCSVMHFV